MASPKSDDDVSGGQPKLSETDLPARPGVYVQVSATPRKKKSSSSYKALESGNHAVEETRPARAAAHQAPRANPGPLGMGSTAEPRSTTPDPRLEPVLRSQSEVREKAPVRPEPVIAQPRGRAPRIVEINESSYEPGVESENTNYRADMVRVSSRPPSMAPERLSAASVLDAKPAVRSEPPAPARTPWVMIALVSVMSAIITAAGVVALQEWMHEKDSAAQAPSAPAADAPTQAVAPAPTQPAVVPAPVAPAAAEPMAAEAVPAAPSAEAAPTALAAQPTPVEATPQPAAAAPQAESPAPAAAAAPAPVAPSAVAPGPVAEEKAPDAQPVKTSAPARATAPIKRPVATEPAKPSLAFRKPPESWGTDDPASAPAPVVDTAAIPSNPYAGDVPVAP